MVKMKLDGPVSLLTQLFDEPLPGARPSSRCELTKPEILGSHEKRACQGD